MIRKMNNAFYLIALALAFGACTGSGGEAELALTLDPEAADAELRHRELGGPASRFWLAGAPDSFSAELFFENGDESVMHHLDMWDTRSEPLSLEPGLSFVGGPVPHDRGYLDDYVADDGTMQGPYLEPWIDLVLCEGTHDPVSLGDCTYADRVDVEIDEIEGDDGLVRVSYVGYAGQERIASGSVVTFRDPGDVFNFSSEDPSL